MIRNAIIAACVAAGAIASTASAAEATLKMVSLDMEGGGGTLFVTPEGKSLLIDTGSTPRDSAPVRLDGAKSDVDRILAAASALGVKKIDYLIITHYHGDHIGGVFDLLKRFPVGTIIDHGPNREREIPSLAPDSSINRMARDSIAVYPRYLEAIKGHKHIEAKPGDVLHFGSLTDTIVTSDSKVIARPLPGAGGPGSHCDAPPMDSDGGLENAESVGSILSFGKVKIAAFGDLTWNREHDLFCPIDRVGHVDILLVTHHGTAWSSNPASIAAMRPDIAVMGNSATKGAVPAVVNVVSSSPGLQGFWKLHASTVNPELNGDPDYIANLEPAPDYGKNIRLDIARSGKVTVTNSRNGFSKTYQVN
ncbi:MAG TPA: MBL fold metallo-hydrolase [Caulobacterales bacterium]|nr:MBL fold metallo-hydrolase [Caulobacterales bacterium]